MEQSRIGHAVQRNPLASQAGQTMKAILASLEKGGVKAHAYLRGGAVEIVVDAGDRAEARRILNTYRAIGKEHSVEVRSIEILRGAIERLEPR